MDTSTVSSALSASQTGAAIGTAVLKKALDIQEQNAMQLLESLPEPQQYNNPPGIGNSVDTFA